MALTPGTRLGSYEIIAPIGAGGMGEVYRARDSKLDRDVAVKILPDAFANDHDRVMRFTREAKTLASLNHPNIAAIYGIEGHALVMELVEGEDLSAHIARGPMPLADALAIARQIIDALEAAHEQGIVHRDLKPQNIKLRADGAVKVLDFGLAKAMLAADESGGQSAVANSPTMTSPALTAMGVILGTAAYMSPEQAKGRAVDKRADIWAFGAVLFEMLTGRRAFQGDDVSDLLVAVLSKDADMRSLPTGTPPSIATLLHRCLERDPRKRLRDIGDARHQLDAAAAEARDGVGGAVASPVPAHGRTRAAMIALGVVAALAIAVAVWSLMPRASDARPIYLSVALPDGHALISGPAISRDGQQVAFVSSDGVARPQLYVRRLDASDARPIAGTDDASEPFFSPDARSIAFYAKDGLFKVSLDGGAPVRLADSNSHYGGTWMDDGRIVFNRAWNGGLYTVPENGGAATVLLEPRRPNEYAYTWPRTIPGRRELLFSRWGDRFGIQRLDLQTMTQTQVAPGWRRSAYVPAGFLIVGSDGGENELWAVPYPAAGSTGGKVTVAERVDGGDMAGNAAFDISENGTLAYSSIDRRRRSLVVVDMFGRATPTQIGAGDYSTFAVSPDGRRVVARLGGDLQILDLDRGTSIPLAPELKTGAREYALWTADGNRVVFSSNHEGNWEIYSKAASGSGVIEPVLRRPFDQGPTSLAPDGAMLFHESHPQTGRDLWIVPKGGKPEPWLVTTAEEGDGRFSPNGRLIAYVSNTTGRSQVYVQTRAAGGDRVQVSVNGGERPAWSPSGDRLYFRQKNAMMVATISAGPVISAGTPQHLFDGGWTLPGDFDFHVRPDGQSFLMVRQGPEAIPTRINLVLNWFGELTRRASRR